MHPRPITQKKIANLKPMTDEEVREQVEHTDAFIAAFRKLIASTVVDAASSM